MTYKDTQEGRWNEMENYYIFKHLFPKMVFTHLPLVPRICVSEMGSISSDNGLSPGHYLNQCGFIVN